MGDMGDMYRDMDTISKSKRAANRTNALTILRSKNIDFVIKNNGAHLIVQGTTQIIDFWPGTGKWIVRNGPTGRGIFNMLKNYCNKQLSKECTNEIIESREPIINTEDDSCPFT